jgi:hypothetical protein
MSSPISIPKPKSKFEKHCETCRMCRELEKEIEIFKPIYDSLPNPKPNFSVAFHSWRTKPPLHPDDRA